MSPGTDDGLGFSPFSSDADGDNHQSSESEQRPELIQSPRPRDGGPLVLFSSDTDGDNYQSSENEPRSVLIQSPQPRDGGPLVFRPTTELNDRNQRFEHKYEVVELDEEVNWNERLHCCNGLLPLDQVATAANIMALVRKRTTT